MATSRASGAQQTDQASGALRCEAATKQLRQSRASGAQLRLLVKVGEFGLYWGNGRRKWVGSDPIGESRRKLLDSNPIGESRKSCSKRTLMEGPTLTDERRQAP